jgi:hypothetical protein
MKCGTFQDSAFAAAWYTAQREAEGVQDSTLVIKEKGAESTTKSKASNPLSDDMSTPADSSAALS